ncbi:unnamed protein product [Trichobilharzia szidati]|nr:unnamed protein product [Trichobilharzia szidati]
MDTVHTLGIRFIQWMQSFDCLEPMFTGFSHIGSPNTAYTLTFPIAYYINPTLGITTALCTISSDYLNGVLKWILYGHRPYWWVTLNGLSQDPTLSLKQYPLTCETGPGSPSGHCMITVASVIPIIAYFYYKLKNQNERRYLLWLSSLGFGLVGLSRCYLAAHFPHQVIAGLLSGVVIGLLFHSTDNSVYTSTDENTDWLHKKAAYLLTHPNGLLWLGLGSFTFAYILSLFIQYGLKMDPNWSVTLARSACIRPEWIHLSTSLMNSFSKIAGAAAGLSLALHLKPPTNSKQLVLGSNSTQIVLSSSLFVLITTKFMESLCGSTINLLAKSIFNQDSSNSINAIQLFNSFIQGTICPLTTICVLPTIMSYFHHKHNS